jgi:hypothetical protein
MYVNSAREGFEKATTKNAKAAGYTEELWVLGEAEHCDDCLEYAGEGWQEVGHFPVPGAGATLCKTACQCHLEHRNPDTGAVYGETEAA